MTFSDELNIKPIKPKAGLTLFGRGVDGAWELGVRLGGLGGDHDVGTIPSSLEGDGLPDAPTGARDEDRLPGELPGLRERWFECIQHYVNHAKLYSPCVEHGGLLKSTIYGDIIALRSQTRTGGHGPRSMQRNGDMESAKSMTSSEPAAVHFTFVPCFLPTCFCAASREEHELEKKLFKTIS